MKKSRITIPIITVAILVACQNRKAENKLTNDEKDAAHFELIEKSGYSILEIREPFIGSGIVERFVLYPRGTEQPKEQNVTHYIETPVERIGLTSTTHIAYLSVLNKRSEIKAMVNTDLIYDQRLREMTEKKEVKSLGNQSINQEILIQSELDVLFDYTVDLSAYKKIEQLRSLGQAIIPIAEYMEHDPIAKMNWVKAFAAFFSPTDEIRAKVYVDSVESNYQKYVVLANERPNKPTVMLGYPWQGNWFVSGGKSFQAKYFEDANVEYVWRHTDQTASVALSTETVLKDALDADYWLNPGVMQTKSQLIDNDPRFKNFNAFKQNSVYTNYKRSNSNGANDYWESAVVRPDRVLLDLVTIFSTERPHLDSLYYYKPLGE
ncbi:MAG: hypothetical protein CMO34_02770 [Verrucomicrobia bacterium]|nr:hypothetical protein [Verrucomicrobiota bacterium]